MIYESVTLFFTVTSEHQIVYRLNLRSTIQLNLSFTRPQRAFGVHMVILGHPLQRALNHTWIAQMGLFGQQSAPSPCAGAAHEQAQHMACHLM